MKFVSPETIEEILELLDKYESRAVLISGCTDALVKKDFFSNKEVVVDLNNVNKLKQITQTEETIRIGAGVTFTDLVASDIIKQCNSILYQAATQVGSVQIRNRGTIAGNIVNASPAADSVPALMVSNAYVELLSSTDKELISLSEFFTGPGKTKIKSNQILASIVFDKESPDTVSFFRKIGTRKALSIAKASVAFKATLNNQSLSQVNISYGSVANRVILSKEASNTLEGRILTDDIIRYAANMAYNEVSPITDIRSTAEYRKLVVRNIMIEELNNILLNC